MYCSSCGKEISDDAQFCPFCGSKIQSKVSTQSAVSERAMERKNLAGWLILLIPLVFGSFFFFSKLIPVASDVVSDNIVHAAVEIELNDTFELSGISYTFTDTYTDKEVTFSNGGCIFGSYKVQNTDTIITGCNGLIENRTDQYLDLTTLEAVFRCKNDDEKEQKIRGKCLFYVKPSDALISMGEEIYTLAPGERAYIYVYTIPEEDYHSAQLTLSVKGTYTGKGIEHKAIITLE